MDHRAAANATFGLNVGREAAVNGVTIFFTAHSPLSATQVLEIMTGISRSYPNIEKIKSK